MRIKMPKEMYVSLTPAEEEAIVNCISTLEEIKKQMEDNDYIYMDSTGYGQVSVGEMEDTMGTLEAILNAEVVYQEQKGEKMITVEEFKKIADGWLVVCDYETDERLWEERYAFTHNIEETKYANREVKMVSPSKFTELIVYI